MYAVHCPIDWGIRKIKDKIPDMSPEIVLILVPAVAVCKIWIRVEKTDAIEVWCASDDGKVVRVTDTLRIIRHDDRCADDVCSSREIDNGRGRGL